MPRMSHPPLRKRRRSLILCVLAALLALVATTQPASATDGRPYTNPLKSFKGADPWLQYHDGNHYLITTTFTGILGIRKSPTLGGLATAPNVQVWSDTTSTRNTNCEFVNGGTQSLVIAPLSNPYTLASSTFTVISGPTLDWERSGSPVNEGPEPLYHDGRTFLTYSASSCPAADYKLGQLELTGTDPLSPASWTKKQTPVFQHSDTNGVHGPGHNGFFSSPDGTENWIVYHANSASNGGCGNGRTTRAQEFTWNADGTPNLGTPTALGTTLPGPSGESAATPAAYTLVNRNSGTCLDVDGGGTADGTDIFQWTCNGGTNQKWRVEDLGDDTNRLVNVATGKVMDTADCSAADGANIRQRSWLNNKCQRYRLVFTAAGDHVRIVNESTGKVADVAGCSAANGADVRQWTWLNNNCRQWRLVPTT